MTTTLAFLGRAFELAGGLAFAYELGDRFRFEAINGQLGDDRTGWYPGCGIEATMPTVTCQWCSRAYVAISVEHKQGGSCAASTYRFDREDGSREWRLECHYGSSHDLSMFRWNDYPSFLDGRTLDPVCDLCIDNLIGDDTLEHIGHVELAHHWTLPARLVEDDREDAS